MHHFKKACLSFRFFDLSQTFGFAAPTLSKIINKKLHYLNDNFGYILNNFDVPWLSEINIKEYAAAITRKGSPYDKCWGFTDGTAVQICKPIRNQNLTYNGHKRFHCLLYQSIVIPNGLIANLFGLIEGAHHDSYLLTESGALGNMEEKITFNGVPYYLFGDPEYPLSPYIQKAFPTVGITDYRQNFNQKMVKIRECVEWNFGK